MQGNTYESFSKVRRGSREDCRESEGRDEELRKPEELLCLIKAKGKGVAEVLAKLRRRP